MQNTCSQTPKTFPETTGNVSESHTGNVHFTEGKCRTRRPTRNGKGAAQ